MLKDLDVLKIPFEINGENRYLRYNMNSRLYLEYMTDTPDILKKEPKKWTFDEFLHLLRAMLMDSFYEENKICIENRDFVNIKPTLSELGRYLDEQGVDELMMMILKGIIKFFPEAPIGAKSNSNPHQTM